MPPQVCILLPHFNDFEGLQKSIASIGSAENVDVLVVDDGSDEKINEALVRQSKNFRGDIYFLYLSVNQGICKAINHGLIWIREQGYLFIARLDCGDTCGKQRFEKQWAFLVQHPEIGLVGTWGVYVDKKGEGLFVCTLPTKDTEIRQKIYWSCPFMHPSIMFRTKVLDEVKGYDERFRVGEDLAFYFQVIKHWQVANLPEYLLFYEFDEKSISSHRRKQVLLATLTTLKEHFQWGIFPVLGILKNMLALRLSRKWIFRNRMVFRYLAQINMENAKKWRFSKKKSAFLPPS